MSPGQQRFASDYIDVASRLASVREKYPDGRLRPLDPSQPYRIETVADRIFVVYVAAFYRTADDPMPAVGTAWEPFPGPTNFTRDSELQNAETAAWGRAMVAALAADTKQGIASAEEVRNRSAAPEASADPRAVRAEIALHGKIRGLEPDEIAADFAERNVGVTIGTAGIEALRTYLTHLQSQPVPA